MKKLLFAFGLFVSLLGKAQTVTIPDPNFAAWIQQNYPTCISGNQLDTACINNLNIGNLNLQSTNIIDLTGIQYFVDVRKISLSYNSLLNIIPILPNALDTLICSHNQNLTGFSSLPNSLDYLKCIYNYSLTNLPALPNSLSYLTCSLNNLTSLPALPNSLNTLDCSMSNLSNLPSLPSSLKQLFCYNNSINALPTLPNSLIQLYCDSNQLTNLPVLPNSLYSLSCGENYLTSMPSLPNSLNYLRCDGNNIVSISNLPNSIKGLSIINNPNFKCLPNIPAHLSYLSLYNTGINCLPNYNNFINPSNGYNYILCQQNSSSNPNNCNSQNVTGTSFTDINTDCLYDSFEFPVNGVSFKLINSNNLANKITSSYSNGNFGFLDVPYGTYTLEIDSLYSYLQSCTPSHSIILNTANPDTSGLNFGLQCKPNVFDLGVKSVLPVGPVFPGQQHTLKVSTGDLSQFFNFNCSATQNISATVTVNVSGPVQYVAPANGALIPTSVTGNILTYSISNISTVNLFNSFNSIFKTDTTAQGGDSVCVMVTITTPQSGDVDPLNNTFKYCYVVVNSYDPNIKVVNKAIVKPTFNDWLTYTIYFQNTGNAPAFNIKLVDTLDNALDLNTFEVIGYSHYNSFSLNSINKRLQVNFPNILLPDSTSNLIGSIGYVQYRIKPNAPMALNNQIKNRAGIYFDFNAPIITNTVTTTATNSVGLTNLDNKNEAMILSPNPASQSLTVALGNEKIDYISITELSGKILLKKKVNVGDSKIDFDLSQVENGLYLVNGYLGEKIVKGKKLIVRK